MFCDFGPSRPVTSASAEVWQKYLKAHDKTAQFQRKGCDYYYKWLEIIFNKDNAYGGFHYLDLGIREVECITRSGDRKIQVKDQKGDTHPTSTEPSTRNKGRSLDATSPHVMLDYSIAKCVAALEKMEDISDDIYVKALDKFCDPKWREMFIAMFNDRRRGWLFRL